MEYACVLSHSVVSDSLWPWGLQPAMLLCPWGFSRQEYWSGLPCPPPRDLPIKGSNPGLLYYKQILYHLNHQGSPSILEWVAYPFPTQELNQGLLHCRQILYQLSYQRSPSHVIINTLSYSGAICYLETLFPAEVLKLLVWLISTKFFLAFLHSIFVSIFVHSSNSESNQYQQFSLFPQSYITLK